MDDALEELESVVTEEIPLDGAHELLQEQILVFVGNLRHGSPAGARLT
ncbi:hypothetical protein QT381_15060 [Galbitalea sp. SE-J8]|nr:hypothetical protein [Galbitalea sp. SE-J8]MDM4764323.1 hypothetical protein [Galbitalea sp. SE-J8]